MHTAKLRFAIRTACSHQRSYLVLGRECLRHGREVKAERGGCVWPLPLIFLSGAIPVFLREELQKVLETRCVQEAFSKEAVAEMLKEVRGAPAC